MLLNKITNVEKFNANIIDHDPIVETKKFFNIYNNSIDEPFHKFWFHIENAKFINAYNDPVTTIRFAFNNKNDQIKKQITYWSELSK